MGARARAGAVTDAPLAGAVEKSFLNLNACDCSIGGWVQQCVHNVTLASMTWTKGHHNAQVR